MTSLSSSMIIPSIVGWALPTRLRVDLVRRLLNHVERGRLSVTLPDGSQLSAAGHAPGAAAEVRILRWRAVNRLLRGGDIGFAEAYVDGDWDTPDLVAFLTFCADNLDSLTEVAKASLPVRFMQRLLMLLRRNSKAGSRRNIMAHYDLGNAFFAEWLDREMVYSSAVYADGDDLEAAQRRKVQRIADMLGLDGDQSVLEIGCGWGGLAAYLADAGAGSVRGITLSPAQLAVGQQKIQARGLDDRVSLELRDYRDVEGQYDRVVSIEMFEAVGEAYWRGYFDKVRQALKPGGRAVLQVITIADDRFEHYRAHPDMIQTLVFPGGMLPSKAVFAKVAREAGFALTESFDFGLSYARTLADWRQRFEAAWPRIADLGYSPTFKRLWSYYLAYCEAGFRTGRIDVSLYALEPVRGS
ncbi:cyclopropane-fatty-acyl-phospholipid synthase family protein [Pleomorphomonas sp. NRK KF1]|uniref:SAM-dependent methyltransferase n=1 Tax=Pleomorphomonas sp. NRK KF1 TaxID=2943000 RepID=UPI002044BC9E|nr:cyclopropane-fatty-acyl-phospholipid synthase family protein [Pleomorphomonas sp. NRK KF1]MCM5555860.1 cyclopropane-fatty-acyl-phospholipid synthase family protein [Pleomorphomonas sp. NRK KF1]